LVRRGHLAEAARLLEQLDDPSPIASYAAVDLSFLGGMAADSVGALARRWLRERDLRSVSMLWWFAAVGDTAGIREVLMLSRSGDVVWGGALNAHMEHAAPAYLALARGDSAEALDRFLALPDSLCRLCREAQLTRVQLLTAAGRDAEAARFLTDKNWWFPRAWHVVWALERGRVNERLGNEEEAVEAYALVVDTWRHADPELQPVVEEARAALARLSGERPR
jgi:hypothetical protein